jgi:prophage regulatory protein
MIPKQLKGTPDKTQDDSPSRSGGSNHRFLRLRQVLERIPVSKSTWWAGIKKGIYPKGIKLSARVTVWKEADIDAICNLGEEADHEE